MHTRRHIDDTRSQIFGAGCSQRWQQQMRQQKVAQIVDGKLTFETIIGEVEWCGHHARIIDEYVDFRIGFVNSCGKLAHGTHVAGVQTLVDDLARNCGGIDNFFHIFLGIFWIAYACRR